MARSALADILTSFNGKKTYLLSLLHFSTALALGLGLVPTDQFVAVSLGISFASALAVLHKLKRHHEGELRIPARRPLTVQALARVERGGGAH